MARMGAISLRLELSLAKTGAVRMAPLAAWRHWTIDATVKKLKHQFLGTKGFPQVPTGNISLVVEGRSIPLPGVRGNDGENNFHIFVFH